MVTNLSIQQQEALQEIVKSTRRIAHEGTLMQKAAEVATFTMNAADITSAANVILHSAAGITDALKQFKA